MKTIKRKDGNIVIDTNNAVENGMESFNTVLIYYFITAGKDKIN